MEDNIVQRGIRRSWMSLQGHRVVMGNAGGARSKFSPNGNANDEEYGIKSGKREAVAGATGRLL